MASAKPRAENIDMDRDLDEIMDSIASSEGIDDELVRQCSTLLGEAPGRGAKRPNARSGDAMRARRHLLVARLAFEVNALDRVDVEIEAALRQAPNTDAARRLAGAMRHRQGRLTEAIAIWQDLATSAEVEPSALGQLRHLFALSLREGVDRNRHGAAGGEALQHDGLADLEHALRLGLSNNLAGALRAVDRVILRVRRADRHAFKVAILTRAFLLQQAHDVRGAITTLERVADEPGLANDAERLLCLSELYEREGTPERIRRAIRAVRYAYLMTRRPPLLRRIARLLLRLGHVRLAALFEAHYLETFRRKMHALSLRELLCATTMWYAPAQRLLPLAPGSEATRGLFLRHLPRRRTAHKRRAAVLALMLGDAARADALLSSLDAAGQASPVDLMYLADARELAGDGPGAREVRIRAIRCHPCPDATMLLRLIEPDAPRAADLRAALPTEDQLAQARIAVQTHLEAHPSSAPAWMALAELERAFGFDAQSREHQAHALALTRSARPAHGPFVLAAAALRIGGEVYGLIHEIWVELRQKAPGAGGMEPGDVLGSVTPELRGQAVGIFYAVRAFARAHFPHRVSSQNDIGFAIRFTKDDEISSGDSAGLPMAVAFLSALLSVPVPDDVAMSGAVVCDAHDVITVRRVGDVEAKIEGACERRLRRLLLPLDNREDVERAERIPQEVADTLVVYVATLHDVCRELFPGIG